MDEMDFPDGSVVPNGELPAEKRFCLVCPDFTQYFIAHSQDVSMPVWNSIMNVEIRLRAYMKNVYPWLENFRYSDIDEIDCWQDKIDACHPPLDIHVGDQTRAFMRSADSYGRNVSLLDVLSLSFIIDTILKHWELFGVYFGGNEKKKWEEKLILIKRARNPIAHSHPEYLTSIETNLVQIYCSQILEL